MQNLLFNILIILDLSTFVSQHSIFCYEEA